MRTLPGYRAVQLALDFGRSPEQRQSALLRIRRQAGLFQPFGTTRDDRYPEIFAFVRDALGADAAVHILSFGCSTGEEVASLRRYFSNAIITGLDISPERIAVCRAALPADLAQRTRFDVAETARDEPDGAYDIVLAMAVFRHGRLDDETMTQNRLIAFDRFEREIGELARTVRPGGYLVLRHTNLRFSDTAAAAGFDAVLDAPRGSRLYGRTARTFRTRRARRSSSASARRRPFTPLKTAAISAIETRLRWVWIQAGLEMGDARDLGFCGRAARQCSGAGDGR